MDEVEVFWHHVLKVVCDEDTPHVQLDLITGLSVVGVHVSRSSLWVKEREREREREREYTLDCRKSTLAGKLYYAINSAYIHRLC